MIQSTIHNLATTSVTIRLKSQYNERSSGDVGTKNSFECSVWPDWLQNPVQKFCEAQKSLERYRKRGEGHLSEKWNITAAFSVTFKEKGSSLLRPTAINKSFLFIRTMFIRLMVCDDLLGHCYINITDHSVESVIYTEMTSFRQEGARGVLWSCFTSWTELCLMTSWVGPHCC